MRSARRAWVAGKRLSSAWLCAWLGALWLLGAAGRAAADNLPEADLPAESPDADGSASAKAAPDKAELTAWQRVKTPSSGEPRAIGDYSSGCVQGAQALELDGEGYQVMHPSRLRYFGHP